MNTLYLYCVSARHRTQNRAPGYKKSTVYLTLDWEFQKVSYNRPARNLMPSVRKVHAQRLGMPAAAMAR
eukprot:CAMPEP_0198491304 /NCGR_PEP_ID=MMETSP1462-20131121/2686_1 /TAXON_ID=1333877 /ORGANISM="Brandtodinium nutriculum, Strain RCC3387" /LENGTH=68 /DNA_ID=CAMNT_0044219899 /DNA_START=399 /DNA_END=602 /DNA_ORIENTATION=+